MKANVNLRKTPCGKLEPLQIPQISLKISICFEKKIRNFHKIPVFDFENLDLWQSFNRWSLVPHIWSKFQLICWSPGTLWRYVFGPNDHNVNKKSKGRKNNWGIDITDLCSRKTYTAKFHRCTKFRTSKATFLGAYFQNCLAPQRQPFKPYLSPDECN